jgi:hypothetical protein
MKRALVAALAFAASCTNWEDVKHSYCSFHGGQGNCADGGGSGGGGSATGGGSANGGGTSGGGSATGGGGIFVPDPYDGGPPADWAVALGGASDDAVSSIALSGDESVLGVSGTFTSGIDLGGTSFISAGGNSALAQFIAQLTTDGGGVVDGNGVRCGPITSPVAVPLVFTDAGFVAGSNCYVPSAFHLYDRNGTELLLDGGPQTNGSDPYLFRAGPAPKLQFFNTPEVSIYDPTKGLIALAVRDQPFFVLAANLPQGSPQFPIDAGTDAGSAPHLARVGASDFATQQVDLVDCGTTQTVEWEALAADPTGQMLLGVARNSEQASGNYCRLYVSGEGYGSGFGDSNPGLYRTAYLVSQAGSQIDTANVLSFGSLEADAGPLLVASDSPDTFYFAGLVNGQVISVALDQPTLIAGSFDTGTKAVTGPHQFRAGANSTVQFNALSVEPGVTPAVWLLGTVHGALEDIDGGHIVSSYDTLSDAFLLKLSPPTFAPTQKYVLGAPGFAEEGLALATKGHHVYVATQVTPGSGGGAYAAGGVPVTLPGGRDIVVFRLTVP